MPIKIPDTLPAKEVLEGENIFVMDETSAYKQDIRPLRIAILNLMPTKETTETQLLRLVGNTPIQVDVVLYIPNLIHRRIHLRNIWICSIKPLMRLSTAVSTA